MESWEPSQHLLLDTGKPRKTCVEVTGRRTGGRSQDTDKYNEYRSVGHEEGLDCSVKRDIQMYETARVRCAIADFRSYAMAFLEFDVFNETQPRSVGRNSDRCLEHVSLTDSNSCSSSVEYI